MASRRITVSYATSQDVSEVKKLADENKHELGFVLRPALREAIADRRILVAICSNGELIGFVHFRHRRDAQTKIYDLCVAQPFRRTQIGARLIRRLAKIAKRRGQIALKLCCPEDLVANKFYSAMGFSMEGIAQGHRRRLFRWMLSLDSPESRAS